MKEKFESSKEFWIKRSRMQMSNQEKFNNTMKRATEMIKK